MQENRQEKSPIKQKILLYLANKGVTDYEFYKKSGITRGILSQNNGISEDNIARFLAYAPDVNFEWLLTGKGEMIKTERMVSGTHSDGPSPVNKDSRPVKKENSPVISQLLDTIREQAEEIGKLKALIEELEKRIRVAEDTHATAAAG